MERIKKDYYFFYKAKRIKYETLDCMNDKQVENFLNRNEKFDIIIDDSDHTYDFFTNNIKKFYPAVKSGGIYVLEDFRNQDTLLGLAKRYNEAAGKRLLHNNHLLMDEMFNLIKNKKLFDHYILDKNTAIELIVYNIQGRKLQTLVKGFKFAGYHSINWNASNYPNGVYLIRLESSTYIETQKVLLIK